MNDSPWWSRVAFALIILGVLLLGCAFALQPKISDDWHLLWNHRESAGDLDYMATLYHGWTGRIWLILLATFVLPNPAAEIAYRTLIAAEILLLVALAWYCALGPGAWRRSRENFQAMAIFGALLWLALPARSETVAWLSGNFVYLVPALFGLTFMAWIERVSTLPPDEGDKTRRRLAILGITSFIVGFSAGVSQEQMVAACGAYLALTLLRIRRDSRPERRGIGPCVWMAALGFAVGVAVLVGAPGNYARMGNIAAPGLAVVIERMMLYVPGAFFELGTGATGKNIWLGALVFGLLYSSGGSVSGILGARLARAGFWWAISLVSLLAMAPASNFISTRTVFFAVIFLFIGLAALFVRIPARAAGSDGADDPRFAMGTAVLAILGCLVIVEALSGLLSNASIAAEFANREEIVERAKPSTAHGEVSPIQVPFIATRPAELTFLQNPEHDRMFLASWGRRIGRTIEHDVSESAPLPNSFAPLKAIKFRHKK
jgi:hypothetical protein